MTDFKPGTVVLLDFEPFSWNQLPKSDVVAIATNNGGWATQNGALTAGKVKNVRPLVVIDPEDREQIESLAKVLGVSGAYTGSIRGNADALQAALRSLVAPPKPDEPKGLGAVVEDETAHRWSRARNHDHGNNWREEFGGRWRMWDEFTSVRVLSEGVA